MHIISNDPSLNPCLVEDIFLSNFLLKYRVSRMNKAEQFTRLGKCVPLGLNHLSSLKVTQGNEV